MTCPDPGLIAAHAEGRLDASEAARMDEHIAGCGDCYQVFADTVEFGLAEGEAAGVHRTPVRRPMSLAFVHRPAFRMAAGLLMAAGLVGVFTWSQRHRAPLTPVAQLVEAIGTHRFVEPRLTGGFAHGRLVVLRSGEAPQKLDAQPAAVIAAVATIRAQAEGDTSPRTLGALGITYLVSGDVAAAVKALESATAQEPDSPGLLSDLAAAYLARAEQMDEPADLPKALEVAEKAIALKDPPTEVWFNRALALEKLHLVDAAKKAWEDYLQRDAATGWADEARQHLEALPNPRQSSVEEDKARVTAALDGGQAAVDQLADEDPSLLRDYFEDDLLPAWAEAQLVGHPDTNLHRERARLVGDALFRTTTDALPRNTARALNEPEATATSTDSLRSQALGFRTFREAKRLYDLLESACAPYREAFRRLEEGGSPFAAAAGRQVVTACLFASQQTAALKELDRLDSIAAAHGYRHVQGRIRWLQGLIHGQRGELTGSLEFYRLARTSFEATRDEDGQVAMFTSLGENLELLGDTRGAWRERRKALALLPRTRSPRRRVAILADASQACLLEQAPRSALHFVTAGSASAAAWALPAAVSDTLLRRASIYHSLGDDARAAADLQEARRLSARIGDPTWAKKEKAEADLVEGAILTSLQPEAAVAALERSASYFRPSAPERLPQLHLLLARAQDARGLAEAAEAELLAGIQEVERQRTTLRDAFLQASFLDQSFPLFGDMVRLQIRQRHDVARALTFVERGRARQLVESLGGETRPETGDRAGSTVAPLELEALRRRLPDRLVLVYYLSLDHSLLIWTLTKDGIHFLERPLAATELAHLVAAYRTALERRAPLAVVHRLGGRLHDELVRPLLPELNSPLAWIVVPDATLQSVAFPGLWNRETGRYLVEDYVIGSVPSGSVFVRASAAIRSFPQGHAPRALIVGNPRVDRRVWGALPNLPGAEAEAVDVAAMYASAKLLIGADATRTAFIEEARRSEIIHFAGHAVASASSPNDPRFTGLIFAPDPLGDDSGAPFLPSERGQVLRGTRVVSLAACRTASGDVSRLEGPLSLSRPFLAAGVPNVIATLWDIDDDLSRRFFVVLHRALARGEDPALALRAAQLASLGETKSALAHPSSWAVFVCAGGLGPQSLSKGEVS